MIDTLVWGIVCGFLVAVAVVVSRLDGAED